VIAEHFLGIDLGSSYTKFVALSGDGKEAYTRAIPTLSRRREEYEKTMAEVRALCTVKNTCATGYGRRNISSELQKTELVCAAAGVSLKHPVHKVILDIGGEDIKVIECDADGGVIDFYMNDKCSAGTGTFITEMAERAELDVHEMGQLSKRSTSDRIMNSFCTVFAKSEILGLKLSGVPIEDLARGIYLSVIDRVRKLRIRRELPVFLCGGVIAYHPYLGELLAEKMRIEVRVAEQPQFSVALGAAALARKEAGKRLASG
jgi:predicted CoA-substrate-specific enzyme activase